ncbi:Hypothetical predicted protein [Olea europaea subsp. europaea]|uniref:Uncharacterized protein n=1 Tax=Olea europaea subsp. europaea TaxID=158383 RepID=A0A8S0QFW8_OLEEU|nr:Hypothetical predicted protein [Olea europaea subsp. europaea]
MLDGLLMARVGGFAGADWCSYDESKQWSTVSRDLDLEEMIVVIWAGVMGKHGDDGDDDRVFLLDSMVAVVKDVEDKIELGIEMCG